MKQWMIDEWCSVFKISGVQSNAYLVDTTDACMLVDTGSFIVTRRIIPRIDRILAGRKLTHLILTHTHYDHCFNAAAIIREYGPEVVASVHDVEYALSGVTPLPAGTNKLSRYIARIAEAKFEPKIRYNPFHITTEVSKDVTLYSNRVTVDLLLTPGHTSGSLSVVVNNSVAMVGDTLFGIFPNSVYPPFADNEKTMIQSWLKLLDTGCTVFLPGHGSAVDRRLLGKEVERYTQMTAADGKHW
ncbi:MAG: MBL fold metallo-hydrolase [Spirochaetota bacterium]